MTKRLHDVVLLGATGYTGGLIARQLAKRSVRFAVAGRNEEKLVKLAATFNKPPPVVLADIRDEDSLLRMAGQGRVLINATGPFRELGMPVVRAAIVAKTHYLDTTAEQSFIVQVAEEAHEPAREAGIAVCPSMGFDVVPGDLAANLAVGALGRKPLQRVDVYYRLKGSGYSRGSAQSMFHAFTAPGVRWRGGAFVPAVTLDAWEKMNMPGAAVPEAAAFVPLGEVVTVSRWSGAAQVSTWFLLPRAMKGVAKGVFPWVKELVQGAGKPLTDRWLAAMPDGPSKAVREAFEYEVFARATATDGSRALAVASGHDGYGLTGELLAVYAGLLLKKGFAGQGVLAPSEVAPPKTVTAALTAYPMTLRVV